MDDTDQLFDLYVDDSNSGSNEQKKRISSKNITKINVDTKSHAQKQNLSPITPKRNIDRSSLHARLNLFCNNSTLSFDTTKHEEIKSSSESESDHSDHETKLSGYFFLKFHYGKDQCTWERCWCVFDDEVFDVFESHADKKPKSSFLRVDIERISISTNQERLNNELPENSLYKICLKSSQNIQDSTEILIHHPNVNRLNLWMERLGISSSLNRIPQASSMETLLPRKIGWVKKRSSKAKKEWKDRFLSLENGRLRIYRSKKKFIRLKRPIHDMDTLTCSVKLHPDNDKRFQVITMKSAFYFEVEDAASANNWIEIIRKAIQCRIEETYTKTDPSLGEKFDSSKAIQDVLNCKNNHECADCSNSNPEWASISFGITLCIECCGIHRSLGSHVSKVKSLYLDDWDEELIGLLLRIGNETSNSILEQRVGFLKKPTPQDPKDKKHDYIQRKYISKEFVLNESLSKFLPFRLVTNEDESEPIELSLALCCSAFRKSRGIKLEHLAKLAWMGANLEFSFDAKTDSESISSEQIEIESGDTALHGAIKKNDLQATIFLLLNGADAQITDGHKRSAIKLAQELHNERIFEAIKKYGSIKPSAFAEEKKDLPEFSMVIRHYEKSKGWKQRLLDIKTEYEGEKEYSVAYITKMDSKKVFTKLVSGDIIEVTKPLEISPDCYLIEVHTWKKVEKIRVSNEILAARLARGLKKFIFYERDDPSNPKDSRVFGIDLREIAQRRQGSRDKLIPLFLTKVIGFYWQAWQKYKAEYNLNPLEILNGTIEGVAQSHVIELVRILRHAFDKDEENVDLWKKLDLWKSMNSNLSDRSLVASYLRALNILLRSFFISLPKPLIPFSSFDKIREKLEVLRKLRPQMDKSGDYISKVPARHLEDFIIDLPDVNYFSLKKTTRFAHDLILSTGEDIKTRIKTRHEYALGLGCLFGNSTNESLDDNAIWWKQRVFLLELLIENHENIFKL